MRARSRMHVASIDNTQRPPETSDSFSFSPPPVSLLKTTFFLTALNTATRVSHGDALGDKRRVRRAESGRVSVPLPASSNVTSSLTRGCRLRPIVLADTLQRAITTGMQLRPPSSVPPSYFSSCAPELFSYLRGSVRGTKNEMVEASSKTPSLPPEYNANRGRDPSSPEVESMTMGSLSTASLLSRLR